MKILFQILTESFKLLCIPGLFYLLNKFYLMEERQRRMQMSSFWACRSQHETVTGTRCHYIIKSCNSSRIRPIWKQLS